MPPIEAVRWAPAGDAVRILDQTRLPAERVTRDLRTLDEVCEAIAALRVRGAPAIGIAGAMGLVASLLPHADEPRAAFDARLERHAERIAAARPTAVNLPWAVARLRDVARRTEGPPAAVLSALRAEATAVLEEDRAMCRRIGEHGVALLGDGARVLTHCNAGALATGGIGTALAPVYVAAERGVPVHVWADETRPLLQGSRLTAWELREAGIPVTVLADAMAGTLMARGAVDLVLVGTDRIAANGDVANKIGTYALAVLARHHGVPFYVAAPSSTLDPATPNGSAIPIEERAPDELRRLGAHATAPCDVPVFNPAFDITPAELVTGIVTDRGVFGPPYRFEAAHGAQPR